MSQEQRQNPEELLAVFRLRLAKLHKQASTFAIHPQPHVQIEINNLQKEIVQLESKLAINLTASSDENTWLQRYRAYFVFLLLLAALLLYVFALPYLRLRLYTEATLWALSPPATARQLEHEMFVDAKCGRAVSTTLYQANSTWADVKAHYTAQLNQSGWSTQSNEYAVSAFWRFVEPRNNDTPNLIISIRPQALADGTLPHEIDQSSLDLRDQRYGMVVEYIGDQRGYRSCFHD